MIMDNSLLMLSLKENQYDKIYHISSKYGLSPSTFCRMILINHFIISRS